MELQVYQLDGNETGRTIALDASVFGIEPNDHVLWLDVRRTQASRRQGTHKAKERGEVTGSTRKLYRQKGTGMARAGDIKSPLRRSGGRVFGPRPRSYGVRLTKKTRRLARRSALSYKAREDAIRVVETIGFDQPDTRQLIEMIAALGLDGQKVLVLTAKPEGALYRSSRNLSKIHVQAARDACAEELLGAGVLVCEEGALDVFAEVLAGVPRAASAEADVAEEAEPEAEVAVEDTAAEAAVADAAEEAVADAAEPEAEAEVADEEAVAEAEAAEEEAVEEAEAEAAAEEAIAEADEAIAEAEEAVAEEAVEETEAAAEDTVAEAEEADDADQAAAEDTAPEEDKS